MNSDDPNQLGRTSAAFGWAAVVAVLFNSVLACAKDAFKPLNSLMASLTGHHWTTHGLASIAVFFGLGLLLSKIVPAGKIPSGHLAEILTGAVIVAGLGLVGWFFFY